MLQNFIPCDSNPSPTFVTLAGFYVIRAPQRALAAQYYTNCFPSADEALCSALLGMTPDNVTNFRLGCKSHGIKFCNLKM
jgi:hypothetical protein